MESSDTSCLSHAQWPLDAIASCALGGLAPWAVDPRASGIALLRHAMRAARSLRSQGKCWNQRTASWSRSCAPPREDVALAVEIFSSYGFPAAWSARPSSARPWGGDSLDRTGRSHDLLL
jgi:hypothetical protein